MNAFVASVAAFILPVKLSTPVVTLATALVAILPASEKLPLNKALTALPS
jgi:hypothetical protein